MSYQALYRVWRPGTFKDVVGQEHITKTLKNAIVQQKFSHAYLFSGPRGTGKTSAAKIFAKAINCEHAPTDEPCNECASCRGIQDGSVSDIIEMDAASNTSVEDVREIRDTVKYASSTVSYKVYIIDEVHMISVNAFNALLKTLEEPPQHVVFILATTEPHKIPLTIISRCQRFDFKPISNRAISGRMQEIMQEEDIQVSEDALETVALAAEGGMRDALSILDQAISYSDDQVELSDVLAVTGGVSQQMLNSIVSAMYQQETKEALTTLDDLIQRGKDPGRFVFDLVYFMRDLLLYQSAPSMEDILERARVDETFKELADTVSADWIQSAIIQLNKCQQEMKWSNSPKVFIEVAILTIVNQTREERQPAAATDSDTVQQLASRLEQMEKEIKALKEKPVQQPKPQSAPQEPKRPAPRQTGNSYKIPYEKIRQVLQDAEKQALQQVKSEWASFLNALKQENAPAHATIQDSKPAAASDKALVVAFKYDIHCSLFLDHQETSETVLENTIGKQLTILPIPEPKWQELRQEYIQKQEQKSTDQPKEDENDPLVEEARKLVGDDLLDIKES